MFFFVFLAAILFSLFLTGLAAGLALWIAPYTGLPVVSELDFWNWFSIVLLTHFLTWSTSVAASRSGSR